MQIDRREVLVLFGALFTPSLPLSAQAPPRGPERSGGLLLIDKRGNHIRFFDPVTWKEVSSISTGTQAPHDFALSPDGRTAYVPLYGDGVIRNNPNPGKAILVVDLASRNVTGTIDITPNEAPHGIQVDANGTLYVVCDISRKLLIIDPTTRTIRVAIDIEGTGHWLTVLPDASRAYVTHQGGGDFISVVDLKAQKMVGRIETPGGTGGITGSPDGRRIYAIARGAKPQAAVLVIDTATNAIVDRVALQGHSEPGYKLIVSPDGTTLVTCAYAGGGTSYVNLLRTSDLHGPQRIVNAGRAPMGFAFAPDGRTVLVANDGDGTVTVVDLQKGVVESTFKGGTGIETLTYY
jgi:DNA-binding beta-propeller fold protein YncE